MKDGFIGLAKIYALVDENDTAFYVGCTVQDLKVRLYAHIKEAQKNEVWANALKNNKIRSLDYKISIRQLDSRVVRGENGKRALLKAAKVEQGWIKRFLDAGFELCNRTHANSDFKQGCKLRIRRMLAAKAA